MHRGNRTMREYLPKNIEMRKSPVCRTMSSWRLRSMFGNCWKKMPMWIVYERGEYNLELYLNSIIFFYFDNFKLRILLFFLNQIQIKLPCSKQYLCEAKCKQMRDCNKHACNRKVSWSPLLNFEWNWFTLCVHILIDCCRCWFNW